MKIYNCDGCCIDNKEDVAFGWNMNEISTSALSREFTHKNKRKDESYTNIVVPNIHEYEAKNVIEFGLSIDQSKIQNIGEVPAKTKVADLINPCSSESKMLLSVAHYAKYKNFNREMVKLDELKDNSKLKFISRREFQKDVNIRREIETYNKTKDNDMLSLLMQLILSDTSYDLNEMIDQSEHSRTPATNYDRQCPSDEKLMYQFDPDFLGLPDNIGLDSDFQQRFLKIFQDTSDISQSIRVIKKAFQVEESRVTLLIENAQILAKNLRETTFLDNLIFLLDGKLDRVVSRKCPFQIFIPQDYHREVDLII